MQPIYFLTDYIKFSGFHLSLNSANSPTPSDEPISPNFKNRPKHSLLDSILPDVTK